MFPIFIWPVSGDALLSNNAILFSQGRLVRSSQAIGFNRSKNWRRVSPLALHSRNPRFTSASPALPLCARAFVFLNSAHFHVSLFRFVCRRSKEQTPHQLKCSGLTRSFDSLRLLCMTKYVCSCVISDTKIPNYVRICSCVFSVYLSSPLPAALLCFCPGGDGMYGARFRGRRRHVSARGVLLLRVGGGRVRDTRSPEENDREDEARLPIPLKIGRAESESIVMLLPPLTLVVRMLVCSAVLVWPFSAAFVALVDRTPRGVLREIFPAVCTCAQEIGVRFTLYVLESPWCSLPVLSARR